MDWGGVGTGDGREGELGLVYKMNTKFRIKIILKRK